MTASPPLIDIGALLQPIPGDDPAGDDLRHGPEFDALTEARRMDDDLDQGIWQTTIKKADWKGVVHQASDLLKTRTKDLQVAAWLVQALGRLHGPAGLAPGILLVHGLVEDFWDGLYPRLDDGDPEPRLAPLVWLDSQLSRDLMATTVTQPGSNADETHRFQDWQNAQRLRKLATRDQRAFQAAVEDGEVTVEQILAAQDRTPPDFYQIQHAHLRDTVTAVRTLAAALDALAGRAAPGFTQLLKTLDSLIQFHREALAKRGIDPDGASAAAAESAGGGEEAAMDTPAEIVPAAAFARPGGPRTRQEAYAMLHQIADFLAREEPHSPTSYLVRRAAAWGNLSLPELYAELLGDRGEVGRIFGLLRLEER
ncbi:type VI secretion system protein TssA [Roseomonas genomospecies 6]|nr:type VI secretion system protein TssA [Roseomonas genomospecies 6]